MRNEAVCLGATNVQVLDRGLDLIELLATAEHGMTISELVAATGLPKSTVHRILATFTNRHYVEKNEETSVYSLGYKFVELASLYLNKIVLKTEAEPIMHTLAARDDLSRRAGKQRGHVPAKDRAAQQPQALYLHRQA